MSRPVITLTTDFGAAGPFVGVMKAVIHHHAPDATVLDLTHGVAPCQAGEAGFWLARSYRCFPAGSVHVAVVDPGVGTQRAILACDWDGHVFLAPDNGILPMIAGDGTAMHEVSPQWLATQGWPEPSRTFHGRDIFAPLAAAILTGRTTAGAIGPRTHRPVAAAVPPAHAQAGIVTGSVVAIDNWGNLITNIDTNLLASLPNPRVSIGSRDVRMARTYGDASPGALLAVVNSFGTLEIAWREGNAADLLKVGHGATVKVAPTR
jgi:hypothetical protein